MDRFGPGQYVLQEGFQDQGHLGANCVVATFPSLERKGLCSSQVLEVPIHDHTAPKLWACPASTRSCLIVLGVAH